MGTYIIIIIVLLLSAAAGFAAYYYLKHYNKKISFEHDYLWLGPGEHPFKGKKHDK